MVFGWIAILRFGIRLFLMAPFVAWLAVLATVGVSCLIESRLAAAAFAALPHGKKEVARTSVFS